MSRDNRPRRAGHRAMTKEEQAANRLITIAEAHVLARAYWAPVEKRVAALESRQPWYARLWQRLRRAT